MEYFGFGEQDFVPCEICGIRATDVHHIDNRAMGGSKLKDYIENLAALCRGCHTVVEADEEQNLLLKEAHESYVKVYARIKSNQF